MQSHMLSMGVGAASSVRLAIESDPHDICHQLDLYLISNRALSLQTNRSLNLNQFKARIKNWKAEECSCHLCKRYVAQVGYI